MLNRRVYSYLRFSDPRQALGSSADRQIAYAKQWAEERGMALDESISLRDEGLSAYHQKHIKQGALGAFILAVEEGRISEGSVLIVEGLDRLSRAEPIQAQAQLAQIVNAGITVVTASDSKEYNRERLKANPMDLVYSLLVMIRAHEESDTKSKRVSAAIRRQCEQWIAGTFRGVIRNGKDPSWVRWNGTKFELIPERAHAVRLAVEMYCDGHGASHILDVFKKRDLFLFVRNSTNASFYKMVRRKDLIGTKCLSVSGVDYELEGYYPSILSAPEFSDLQGIVNRRVRQKGKGSIPSILTGQAITYCGYCGAAVVSQNQGNRNLRSDGLPHDGHRRIGCSGKSTGRPCIVGGSSSVVSIEKSLFNYCADQFNLGALLDSGHEAQKLRVELADIRSKITDAERQLERITEALMADEGATPLVFVKKARALEAQLAELQAKEKDADRALQRAGARHTPELAEAWKEIADKALALDYDARMRARQLVADTFERIVIYHRGLMPAQSDEKTIDLLLIGKGGNTRMLRINKKTGEWIAGAEIDSCS